MRFLVTGVLLLALAWLALANEDAPATPAPVSIFGAYTLSQSDKFSEYMDELGVGWWMKMMAAGATPVTTVSKIGDEYSIKTETTFKTTEIKFKLGEEFDELTGDGRECKSTITLDGNSMLHMQRCGGKVYQIDREFTPMQLKMILHIPNKTWVSTRIYTRNP